MTQRIHISVADRLERFGLAARAAELKNLNVKAGAELRLSQQERRHANQIVTLQVKSAHDLKRWLGVPFSAIGQSKPAPAHPGGFVSSNSPFLSFSSVPIPDPEASQQLASYLLSNAKRGDETPAERQILARLDRMIIDAEISISIYLAADIHIEEGATLILDEKVQTLFGNHIILEDDSRIIMEGSFQQIDCARMRYVKS